MSPLWVAAVAVAHNISARRHGHTAMLINLQTLARALSGEVNRSQVLAPGPGHSAIDRSLSVKLDSNAPDGFVVHSFAGDDPLACRDHVREKAGLEPFKPNGGGRQRASNDAIERALMTAVAAQRRDGNKRRIVAKYDYTDAAGVLLYQVLRLEPKGFRQRRSDGNGGWIWELDERRVIYRWPELLKYRDGTVFICEGEKDADRVTTLGHCTTCVAAGKWTEECVTALAGRDVIILEDNDDAGRAKALAAARALHGTAKTIRIVSLPDLPEKGDVSDWLDADPRRAEKLVDVCFDVQVWTPDDNAANAAAEAIGNDAEVETSAKSKPTSELPLPFINIAGWDGATAPEREWVVQDRVPQKNVTLLSGEGGVGKSIVSLHLAVATVLGRDWLSAVPTPGPALVVCCEDDDDELHRRLDRIVEHYSVTFGATYGELKDMHLLSLAGQSAVLAAPNRNGVVRTTKLFERIHEAACDIRPRLIVLDNSADVFAGNENERTQVRQFVTLLRGLAISANAGVLLTSHPSLTGINTGSGLSGSTAWNASVRSRLYFRRAKTEKDEEPDPDLRVLEVMKSNYGPVGETVTVRWKGGLFLPVVGLSNLEKLAAERKAEQVFLTLLDRFTLQCRNTCEKPSAPNYAPTQFAKESEARELGIRKADFEGAMRGLFAADKICLEPYGPRSRGTSRLVRK
jgi:RecA-family ATPase